MKLNYRVGQGFDVHAFGVDRKLILGGIEIPHDRGLVGHSDADVLLHAICDALLGAANLRDIGFHFKNTDPRWKGISSIILLKETVKLLEKKGFQVGNIDAMLCLEAPKINRHISQMQINIAEAMGIDVEDISIKATTNETMGFIGREEGVVAYAVCLIEKISTNK